MTHSPRPDTSRGPRTHATAWALTVALAMAAGCAREEPTDPSPAELLPLMAQRDGRLARNARAIREGADPAALDVDAAELRRLSLALAVGLEGERDPGVRQAAARLHDAVDGRIAACAALRAPTADPGAAATGLRTLGNDALGSAAADLGRRLEAVRQRELRDARRRRGIAGGAFALLASAMAWRAWRARRGVAAEAGTSAVSARPPAVGAPEPIPREPDPPEAPRAPPKAPRAMPPEPLRAVPPEAPRAVPPAAAAPGKRLRVLVVDDNAVNCVVLRAILLARGHEIVTATDGEAALAELGRGRFDVVLMDAHMPVMDGAEATARLRQAEREAGLGAHVPVIGVTASVMPEDRARLLAHGMDDCVGKPVRADHLLARIDALTGPAPSASPV